MAIQVKGGGGLSNIQKLISLILSDEKLQNSKSFSSQVYKDEPILHTAAQMKNYLPPEIRAMKKLAQSYDAYHHSDEWLFYEQGKMMEMYEDDFPNTVGFSRYYPTYRSMNNDQLRTYFTWRTKVRHGTVEKTDIAYALVYLYELLNQIGVPSPEEGFTMLRTFWETYRQLDAQIDSYMPPWLRDYVVYYGLDRSLLEDTDDLKFERILLTLLQPDSHSTHEIFSALVTFSTYHMEKSRFYQQYSEDMEQVVCNVFSALSSYYEKYRKKSFCESLFGQKVTCTYFMFRSAVFYLQDKQDREYAISPIHRYRCRNGIWTCEKYYGSCGKHKELGAILKTVDSMMREAYDFRYPMKPATEKKYLLNLIQKEIDQFLAEKKAHAAPKFEMDISKLQDIRREAAITRDKLIVDTEPEEPEYFPEPTPEPVASPEILPEQTESAAGLDAIEVEFLQCLLQGKPYDALLREHGVMLSVLVDSINEKLFDQFADTVILFEGDVPELIEDYADELKGMITP